MKTRSMPECEGGVRLLDGGRRVVGGHVDPRHGLG